MTSQRFLALSVASTGRLSFADMAQAGRTCRAWRDAAAAHLAALCADFAGSQEGIAIPCHPGGSLGGARCPAHVVYVASVDALMQSAHVEGAPGCRCTLDRTDIAQCDDHGCECARHGPLYDSAGRLTSQDGELRQEELLKECGPACDCGTGCTRRVTQRGVRAPVRLVQSDKGWGVHASAPIVCGTFVALYIGEYVRNEEAEARLRRYDAAIAAGGMPHGHALLVVREVLSSGLALRINIDATHLRNLAGFVNHSCDPNLEPLIVRSRGCLLPRVALFTRRNVSAGEELTFSYGVSTAGGGANARRCLCGASACSGYLPNNC